MGIRVKVGFKDNVGVQSEQNGQGGWKKILQAPSAPPYVWPVAVDPWQLSWPGGQGGGGESRTRTEETSPPCDHNNGTPSPQST